MSFSCPDCQQTFNNPAARSHHRWSQHSEIPPITVDGKEYSVERKGDRLLCPVEQCGRSYASQETFMKHVKAAHAIVRESLRSYPSPAQLPLTGKALLRLHPLNVYSFTSQRGRRLRLLLGKKVVGRLRHPPRPVSHLRASCGSLFTCQRTVRGRRLKRKVNSDRYSSQQSPCAKVTLQW
jgi:uncharacterized C2H2 Zn-finger protein